MNLVRRVMRPSAAAILSFFAVSLTACSDDAQEGQAEWRLSCSEGNEVGPCNYTTRQVSQIGEDSADTTECRIEKRGEMSALYLSAFGGSEYGIEVRNLEVAQGGGPVLNNGCQVLIQAEVQYSGRCGSAPASFDQPCSFSSILVDDRTVEGTFTCTQLPSPTDALALRDVTGSSRGEPASFRFENCGTF